MLDKELGKRMWQWLMSRWEIPCQRTVVSGDLQRW